MNDPDNSNQVPPAPADKINPDVLKYGRSSFIFENSAEEAEAYCKRKTRETGRLHELYRALPSWYYAGGRQVLMVIPEEVTELLKERDDLRKVARAAVAILDNGDLDYQEPLEAQRTRRQALQSALEALITP